MNLNNEIFNSNVVTISVNDSSQNSSRSGVTSLFTHYGCWESPVIRVPSTG